MAVVLKRLKDAVVDGDGKVQEAAGLVIDCGDGIEQVVTMMVTPLAKEVEVLVLDAEGNPLVDADGKETGETKTETVMVETAVPIATLLQNAPEFEAAAQRYGEAYLRGKEMEAVLYPVKLEASAEVLALLRG